MNSTLESLNVSWNEEMYDYTDPLNFTVAVLTLIIAILGVCFNVLVILNYVKEKSERTAFNLICFFRAISNIIILVLIFVINYFPKTLLGYSPWSHSFETWCIHVANTLYLGNEYQIVLVALNRFCAFFFPIHYAKIFGISQTSIVLVLIYVYRIVKKIYEQVPQVAKGCYAVYSPEKLAWYYDTASQCDFQPDALVVTLYTFIAMSILNSITFVKIITFYGGRMAGRDNEAQTRTRKNVSRFVQTILQDSLYLVDLTFTFELSSLSDHRVWTYISGTFIWECVHTVDGFIVVMFNDRMVIRKKTRASSTVISPVSNVKPSIIRPSI